MKTVQDIKMDLLRYARRYNLPSDALVQAMAETLATVAHTLDNNGFACNINDRLETFGNHVIAEHSKLLRSQVTSAPLREFVRQ